MYGKGLFPASHTTLLPVGAHQTPFNVGLNDPTAYLPLFDLIEMITKFGGVCHRTLMLVFPFYNELLTLLLRLHSHQ
jgi:hypothetical protein